MYSFCLLPEKQNCVFFYFRQTVSKITYNANDCVNGTDPNFLTNLHKELTQKKPFSNNIGLFLPHNTDSLVSLSDAMYDINLNGYIYRDNLHTIKDKLKESWKMDRPGKF